jgi:hypothetical protein
VLRGALYDIYPLDEKQCLLIEEYSAELESKIVETAGKALADLAPARLGSGQGETRFAVNRRNNPEGSVPKLIEQKFKGPVRRARAGRVSAGRKTQGGVFVTRATTQRWRSTKSGIAGFGRWR